MAGKVRCVGGDVHMTGMTWKTFKQCPTHLHATKPIMKKAMVSTTAGMKMAAAEDELSTGT